MLNRVLAPALAVLATVASLTPTLLAEPAGNTAARPAAVPPPRAPAPGRELSAAQRQQIDALQTKTQSQLAPLREQLVAKHKELDVLWAADAPNRAAILKKTSEIDAIRQSMRQIGIDHRIAYLALLTPEQRTAWKSRHGSRMGPGGMGMGAAHGGMGAAHGGMGPGGTGMGRGGMGMGAMHGGMGMGPSDDCPGLEDCSDCDCAGGGACVQAPGPAPAAPAVPPAAPKRPAPPLPR